jgi:lysophospholipase L1-like esterase
MNMKTNCESRSVRGGFAASVKALAAVALAAGLAQGVWAKPEFVLPKTLYAAPGIECNIYFGEIFDAVRPDNFAFEVLGEKGACLNECWRWTPKAEDGGRNVRLVLNAWNDDGLAAAATVTVRVARNSVNKKRVTMALLSASSVNCCYPDQIMKRMHECGYTGYTPVGSHSSGTMCTNGCEIVPGRAPHDGYGGFAFSSFLNRWRMTPDEFTELQSDAEREQLKSFGYKLTPGNAWRRHLLKSPLLRLKNGKPTLDVQHWFNRINGGDAPDVILIVLGGNGVFSQRPHTIDAYLRDKEFANADILVKELRKAAPKTLIALATRYVGSADQDSYGKGYGCQQSQVQARRNFFAYNRALEEFVAKSGDPRMVLVPMAQALDPVNGYPQVNVAAFSGSKIKVRRANNALHPTLEGGMQLGDAIAAWLMCTVME